MASSYSPSLRGNLTFFTSIKKVFGNSQLANIIPMIVVAVIFSVLLIPLPGFLLDFSMAINLGFAFFLVLLVIMNKRIVDIAIFPQFMLLSTVFSLVLNISSTRLILTKGMNFDGTVVKAFATFVVGSTNATEGMVVGVIVFIALIAGQYFVITKGATRVSEVAARFTLDQLPQKQMALESEFNSGLIDEKELERKKKELSIESGFFGSMDGASKFISGSVLVGFLLTAVNIIGGLATGIAIKGYSAGEALRHYTILTIGDGLVSQFPSLLISLSTGLLVTRSISEESLGVEVAQQLGKNWLVYFFVAIFFLILGLLKGFSIIIFWPIAALFGFIGYRILKAQNAQAKAATEAQNVSAANATAKTTPTTVSQYDQLQLCLGAGLVPLADESQGGDLRERVRGVRNVIAAQFGFVTPDIRMVDNLELAPTAYTIKIRNVIVGKGEIKRGHFMAINLGSALDEIDGEKTFDPAFHQPAIWIREDQRSEAERKGYEVVDGANIITTHLSEIIQDNAWDLLGRQNVATMLDSLKKDYPNVVEDAQKLPIGDIQKVLQGLLKEKVSIRNMVCILETLGDFAALPQKLDIPTMIDGVRLRLSREIVAPYVSENNTVKVITLDSKLENIIFNSLAQTSSGEIRAALSIEQRQQFDAAFNAVQEELVKTEGHTLPVLTGDVTRRFVYQLVSTIDRNIKVFAASEIPEDVVPISCAVVQIDLEAIGE